MEHKLCIILRQPIRLGQCVGKVIGPFDDMQAVLDYLIEARKWAIPIADDVLIESLISPEA